MRSGFSFSRQSKSAYPLLTWMPKCARYHAAIAFGSRAFMNTPPMPVTFSISAAFLMLSCDEDRVDQRQPAARSKAPIVINRSVFMVIVIRRIGVKFYRYTHKRSKQKMPSENQSRPD